MRVWVSFFLLLGALAGPAWAYRDKKLEEAVAKAEAQLSKGKPDEATKGLVKVAQSLKTGEAYVALGRMQERTGSSIDDAVASFAKAKELGGGDGEILAAVAVFELQTASAKQALETAQAAVKAPGAGADAKAALALALTASNDPTAGLKAADEALALSPTSALAHEAKGQALFVTGNAAGALGELGKAVELDPKSVGALVKQAVVLASEGKNTQAEAAAKRALEINKNSAAAMAAKAVAIVGVDAKRWAEAISTVQEGAFLNARSAFVRLSAGKVFEANGDYDQASQSYRKALEADPGFVAARLALVTVQVIRGDAKGAQTEAERLVKELPQSGEAHLLLARVYIAAKDYQKAEPELGKAVELLPGNAEAHADLAKIKFFNGKHQLALDLYKKALDLKPDKTQWRSDYALLLARLGHAAEGLVELRKVVDAPGYNEPAGLVNLGYLYRSLEPPRMAEAIVAYRKALEMKPKREMAVQAWLGLTMIYPAEKKHDLALEAYQKLLPLEPSLEAFAYHGMGWCYVSKRDAPQAKAMVAKVKAAGKASTPIDTGMLEAAIRRLETPLPPTGGKSQREILWAEIEALLRSPVPAQRLRAVALLAKMADAEGADGLIYVLSADQDFGVREAAADALGNMGKAAAKAEKYLRANQNLDCSVDILFGDVAKEVACISFKRASRQAFQKLGFK